LNEVKRKLQCQLTRILIKKIIYRKTYQEISVENHYHLYVIQSFCPVPNAPFQAKLKQELVDSTSFPQTLSFPQIFRQPAGYIGEKAWGLLQASEIIAVGTHA
jgi:hypothetical protein